MHVASFACKVWILTWLLPLRRSWVFWWVAPGLCTVTVKKKKIKHISGTAPRGWRTGKVGVLLPKYEVQLHLKLCLCSSVSVMSEGFQVLPKGLWKATRSSEIWTLCLEGLCRPGLFSLEKQWLRMLCKKWRECVKPKCLFWHSVQEQGDIRWKLVSCVQVKWRMVAVWGVIVDPCKFFSNDMDGLQGELDEYWEQRSAAGPWTDKRHQAQEIPCTENTSWETAWRKHCVCRACSCLPQALADALCQGHGAGQQPLWGPLSRVRWHRVWFQCLRHLPAGATQNGFSQAAPTAPPQPLHRRHAVPAALPSARGRAGGGSGERRRPLLACCSGRAGRGTAVRGSRAVLGTMCACGQ